MEPFPLRFERQRITARLMEPSGKSVERPIEVRTHPITGRTCRIAFSRINEKEAGAEALPEPPPEADNISACPFCRPQMTAMTPRLHPHLGSDTQRLVQGNSVLFPNLFPYGAYSAVSLFNNDHFVEIGSATASSYTDCFINCRNYLAMILKKDRQTVYCAITQNHLPSAGGSLIHPHLQINADRIAPNFSSFPAATSRNVSKPDRQPADLGLPELRKIKRTPLYRRHKFLAMAGGVCTGGFFRDLGHIARDHFNSSG